MTQDLFSESMPDSWLCLTVILLQQFVTQPENITRSSVAKHIMKNNINRHLLHFDICYSTILSQLTNAVTS